MHLSTLYHGSGAGSGIPDPPSVPLEYVGKAQNADNDQTSYSYPSVSCGATGANRTMFFGILLENPDNASFTPPTVQIDGNIIAPDHMLDIGTGGRFIGIYRARPAGATCSIQISGFGVNSDNNVVYVWRADALVGKYDQTVYGTQSATSSNILRRTLGVPADGFMVGFFAFARGTGSVSGTLSGDITTADDSATDGSNAVSYAISYDNDGNPDDSITFGCTPDNTARRTIIAVSYYYQSSPPEKVNCLFTPLGSTTVATAGRTVRTRIPAAALAGLPEDTDRLVLRFTSALISGSTAIAVDKCYIGHAAPSGDAYDAADLTQVSLGGSTSFSITNSNEDGWESDPISFPYDGTSDLILTLLSANTGTTVPLTTVTGANHWERTGDHAATLDASLFSLESAGSLSLIECLRGWKEP
jgi:hypothetical protein